MKTIIAAISAAALIMAGQPVWPQTTSQQPANQQTAPGGGGTSQTGVPGQPGSKSGPAEKSGPGMGMGTGTAPAGADPSGVKGLPGNKSGPSTREPSQNR